MSSQLVNDGFSDNLSRKFIVLDTWVLSEFTRHPIANNLSNFINKNDLTILLDKFSLIELYNPQWFRILLAGHTRFAIEFLIDHPTSIVDPQEIQFSEIRAFPDPISQVPIATNLESFHWSTKEYLLKGLLGRDKDLLKNGIDMEIWSNDYKLHKSKWLSKVQEIIDDAAIKDILMTLLK